MLPSAPGLTWEDPSTIGFVFACYQGCALDDADLRRWAESVLLALDESPPYILDLMAYEGTRAHVSRTIGFQPPTGLSARQQNALAGIAYARGSEPLDGIGRNKAIAALKACPEILERFRRTFPFIVLDDPA